MKGIYEIRNKIDNKRYIGKSKNINKRFASHKYYMKKTEFKKKMINRYLHYAAQKYGIENFEFNILENCEDYSEDQVKDIELFYMDLYQTCNRKFGYNLRRDSSSKHFVSDETRRLQSISQTGEKNGNYGNYWSDEQKEKASQIAIKRHQEGSYGDEWKKKLSKASSELWKDESKKQRMAEKLSKKKQKYDFYQYDKNNNVIKKFESIKQIITENPNYKWQNIYSVCNGYKKSYMGFIWKKQLKI